MLENGYLEDIESESSETQSNGQGESIDTKEGQETNFYTSRHDKDFKLSRIEIRHHTCCTTDSRGEKKRGLVMAVGRQVKSNRLTWQYTQERRDLTVL